MINIGKARDLTGFKIGKLTVLYKTDKRKNGSIVWHCKCECGNECDVSAGNLTRSTKPTRSCGCLHIESAAEQGRKSAIDLTGQKFGRLTALEPLEERAYDKFVIWRCVCECGSIVNITSSNLIRGLSRSCGCTLSHGEEKIAKILSTANIPFLRQKTFKECLFENGQRAKFDFYINDSYLLEYDGSQHFEYKDCGWDTKENFEKTQFRDNFKNQWCKKNNIPLIRIPYTQYKNLCLEDLLLETTKFRIV